MTKQQNIQGLDQTQKIERWTQRWSSMKFLQDMSWSIGKGALCVISNTTHHQTISMTDVLLFNVVHSMSCHVNVLGLAMAFS